MDSGLYRSQLGIGRGHVAEHMDEEAATRASVLDRLSSHDWAHFTCHGTVAANPFDSALLLHGDDRLSLNDIIKQHLPNAKFAFLAACHTAEQSEIELRDEVLHLAGAMQFSGFRSVIGTLWEMEDKDGPNIAKWFYETILMGDDDDGTRHTRAAKALSKVTRILRNRKVPLERWANYVHIGA